MVRIIIHLLRRIMTAMMQILLYIQGIRKRVMLLIMIVMASSMKAQSVLVLPISAWIQPLVLFKCIVIPLLVYSSHMDEAASGPPILIGFLAPMSLHGPMSLLWVVVSVAFLLQINYLLVL